VHQAKLFPNNINFNFKSFCITYIKLNVYGLLRGKPKGKRSLGRPKCWWIILKYILEGLNEMYGLNYFE
jgi:hypothetical protein